MIRPDDDEEQEIPGGHVMILLVIDMQNGLVDEDLYDYENFLNRTVRLVDAARTNGA